MANYIKYFELLAFFAALVAWPVLKHEKGLKWFPFLLGFICTFEWLAFFLKQNGFIYNGSIYNICGPLVVATYLFILRAKLNQQTIRIFLLAVALFFLVMSLFQMAQFSLGRSFNTFVYSAGAIIICIGAALNIGKQLQTDDQDIFLEPAFYIWGILMIYYLVSLPYFNMNNWAVLQNKKSSARLVLLNSMALLNYLLYGTYTIVFLWMKKKGSC